MNETKESLIEATRWLLIWAPISNLVEVIQRPLVELVRPNELTISEYHEGQDDDISEHLNDLSYYTAEIVRYLIRIGALSMKEPVTHPSVEDSIMENQLHQMAKELFGRGPVSMYTSILHRSLNEMFRPPDARLSFCQAKQEAGLSTRYPQSELCRSVVCTNAVINHILKSAELLNRLPL